MKRAVVMGALMLCACDFDAALELRRAQLDAGSSEPVSRDAGSSDAGAIDAGSIDAGSVDAGSVDAGSVDAGSVDAGSVDAGLVDAGAVDAGFTDAGSVDAGPIDAGCPMEFCPVDSLVVPVTSGRNQQRPCMTGVYSNLDAFEVLCGVISPAVVRVSGGLLTAPVGTSFGNSTLRLSGPPGAGWATDTTTVYREVSAGTFNPVSMCDSTFLASPADVSALSTSEAWVTGGGGTCHFMGATAEYFSTVGEVVVATNTEVLLARGNNVLFTDGGIAYAGSSTINTMHALADGRVFAGTSDHTIIERDPDGGWSSTPVPGLLRPIDDVFAISSDDVWLCSTSGGIFHRTAAGWSRPFFPSAVRLPSSCWGVRGGPDGLVFFGDDDAVTMNNRDGRITRVRRRGY